MPAGGARGSELELGTFTHKSPCQVRVAPTRSFWTEILFLDRNCGFRGTISDSRVKSEEDTSSRETESEPVGS